MRVTVCEMPDEAEAFERAWLALARHCRSRATELVLLPELPFSPWFGASPRFEAEAWRAAEDAHRRWIGRLPELAPAAVLATAPVTRDGHRLNEGFVWDAEGGYRAAHHKFYLPDEEGVWEARWYERGDGRFETARVGGAAVGFAVCSELWALERARAYGRAGAHVLAVPRLTGRSTVDKWLAGGRAAAVVSGAYSLSSNRASAAQDFGGGGWIVGPDGEVLATTSAAEPFATADVDLALAERAKSTYPRYLLD
jgi:N-carbamoylputrescine amidase